jgi:tellurium resistance protein TerZ
LSINLQKNSPVSLKKADGSALSKIVLALGWDEAGSAAPAKKGLFGRVAAAVSTSSIDLDASAILLDSNKNVVDQVWFQQKKSRDGSIKHGGDNLTGAGDGDDESIEIDLSAIASNVQSVVFVITSYSGQTFDQVSNVFARVLDVSAGRPVEVNRYDLAESGSHTAKVIVKIFRSGSGWEIEALGRQANGRTVRDLFADAQAVA